MQYLLAVLNMDAASDDEPTRRRPCHGHCQNTPQVAALRPSFRPCMNENDLYRMLECFVPCSDRVPDLAKRAVAQAPSPINAKVESRLPQTSTLLR
jgi:hypothetical protein